MCSGKGGNLALAGRRRTKGGQQRMIFGQAASFVKEMFTTFNQENQEREAEIRRQEMEEERRERDRERQHQAEVEAAEREKERRFRAEQAQLDREAEERRFSMLAQGNTKCPFSPSLLRNSFIRIFISLC